MGSTAGAAIGAGAVVVAAAGVVDGIPSKVAGSPKARSVTGPTAEEPGAGATAAPSSASGFGNVGMSSPGKFMPPTLRAFGGSVSGKTPYMVGERGPELFVPGGNGTIIPNSNMRGGGGGSPISISVDARGSNDPAAVRAQVQQGILEAAPAIIAAAESRTIAGLRRPRLGGAMQ